MERIAFKPEEVATMLGISVASVYRAIKADEIPAEKVNGRILIPAGELFEKFGRPESAGAA